MDQSNYKQTKTKRGLTYSYFCSPSASSKPILFLSHGFPSASFLWRKQVPFFQQLGYGLIVPDHLGYGGTDKPTDPKLYVGRGLAADMVDILDAEGVTQVVAIGHDWGSYLVSRMLHYCPHRVSACAFFAVGYKPAEGDVNLITRTEQIKKRGRIDSFINLLYPETPELWKKNMSDKEVLRKSLLSGGLSAPLCWYKAQVEEANLEEDAKLSPSARDIAQPFLYVAFTKDYLALPILSDPIHGKYVKGPMTRKEIDGDHWGVMSHAAELNEILLEWMGSLASVRS
ncbi:alpha/beta-hydrolase [Mycena olivaceomarginata]|nr:alpha/beta-hydrolase [Mycena olivaceomarginata]